MGFLHSPPAANKSPRSDSSTKSLPGQEALTRHAPVKQVSMIYSSDYSLSDQRCLHVFRACDESNDAGKREELALAVRYSAGNVVDRFPGVPSEARSVRCPGNQRMCK